jgi:hypothetical protein
VNVIIQAALRIITPQSKVPKRGLNVSFGSVLSCFNLFLPTSGSFHNLCNFLQILVDFLPNSKEYIDNNLIGDFLDVFDVHFRRRFHVA